MREALNNIFKPAETVTTFVTIRERLSSSRYEVEDVSEKRSAVEAGSGIFYPIGVRVIVQNGRIIGAGHRAGAHKTYEV